jgi:hypothetical protein
MTMAFFAVWDITLISGGELEDWAVRIFLWSQLGG